MIYGSVCSGIEAASAAWHPLGWRAAFLSEIDAFPRAVLSHHYADVPLHGDFTTIQAGQYDAIDLLVGGTPCQSFSVAGLRGGLDDERGNLALEFLKLAHRLRPRWVVWENVPGVLSSNGGRDFGAILGGLVELGYGFAYRVLDAQFYGVPQRRRRVFVVGCLGDWRRAAAVLFERHSLSGHPAPRREAGARVAPCVSGGAPFGRTGNERTEADALVAGALSASATYDRGDGTDPLIAYQCHGSNIGPMGTMVTGNGAVSGGVPFIAHALRAEGFDASEDGTGRGTPLVPVVAPCLTQNYGKQSDNSDTSAGPMLVPVAFDTTQITSRENRCNPQPGDPCHPLAAGAHPPAIAMSDVTQALVSNGDAHSGFRDAAGLVPAGMAVRRLTPRECERLQGFPDDYTLVPYRNKPATDGPRYKALGNSMAVPCMAWIGRRIALVDALITVERAA